MTKSQLALKDFIKEYPAIYKTDRDTEEPNLVEFVKKRKPKTLLDIGVHSSWISYASRIREFVKRYDGIDIMDDPEARKIVDNYYVGNALKVPLEKYEMVICVSTIEHAGISTYKVKNWIDERYKLFERCLDLAQKWVWISFPVGLNFLYPDELATIDREQLGAFENMTRNYKVKERFFYSQGPQAGHPWYEHGNRELALKIPYIDFIGNQSICVMEIEK